MKNLDTRSGLHRVDFIREIDGKSTDLYLLTNQNKMEVAITNYGAKIVSLMALNRKGEFCDVVLGHNNIEEYLHSEEPYFGAICGRYANRICKGRFTLDGITYDRLAINNGPNALHGGLKGFNAVVWDATQTDPQTLVLEYTSQDGEEGYPGELKVQVIYHLSEDNALEINYKATTTKPTVLNLTNHSYFNLSGAGDPYIGDHSLQIDAAYYLPTDETAIPYGKKEKVEGTPMDFTTPHLVGERINAPFQQLEFGRGYDHTYVLNKKEDEYALVARCSSPKTGIVMEAYTSQPGMQLYTGNWMTGNFVGKAGKRYPMRAALCLEMQHFPDSPNHPEYPTTVLRPNEVFESKTAYKFSVE